MNTFPHDAITFLFLMRSFAMMTDMCPTCMCHQCGEHNPTTTCSIESHVSSTHNESRALHVCRTSGIWCYAWIFSLLDVLHCRNSECCILDEIQNANDVFGDNMNSWCQETWMMWLLFLSQIRHMFVQVHAKISVIQWYWLFRRVVTFDLHRRSVSGCTHETFYIAVCFSDEAAIVFWIPEIQNRTSASEFLDSFWYFLFPLLWQSTTAWSRFISPVMYGNAWHLIFAVSHQGWRRSSLRLLPPLSPRRFALIFSNNQYCPCACWLNLWIAICWAPAHAKAWS